MTNLQVFPQIQFYHAISGQCIHQPTYYFPDCTKFSFPLAVLDLANSLCLAILVDLLVRTGREGMFGSSSISESHNQIIRC